MSKYYPSKGPSLIPSTAPNIWPTHAPSAKPSNMQSFHHSELLIYFTCGYPRKYSKVEPKYCPTHCSLLIFHIALFLGVISHTPTYYKHKHKNISLYHILPIFLVDILCSWYLQEGEELDPVPGSSTYYSSPQTLLVVVHSFFQWTRANWEFTFWNSNSAKRK